MKKIITNRNFQSLDIDSNTDYKIYFKIDDLARFLQDSKEDGADKVELMVNTDFDGDLELATLQPLTMREETLEEYNQRLSDEQEALKARADRKRTEDLRKLAELKAKYPENA